MKSRIVLVVVCVVACAIAGFAQTSNSTIGGTVVDPTGALIPGVTVNALNVLNHPIFGNPTLDINNASFGRITTATGSRSFTINTRLNF